MSVRGTLERPPAALSVTRRLASVGRRAGSAARAGFSLIEMMVVLIIIGIAASMLTLSAFPDRNQGLRQEAQRLVELFKLAQIEARTDGRRIEWQFDAEGYRFMRVQRSAAPTPDRVRHQVLLSDFFEQDPLLRPRRWQTALIRIDGSAMAFTAEWLLPPAQIVLHGDEAQLTIVRDAAGHYEIH